MICLSTVDLSLCMRELQSLADAGVKVVEAYPNHPDWHQYVCSMSIYISGASTRFSREYFSAAANLEIVFNPNTGQDHIDFDFLRSKGVEFFTIRDKRELLDRLTATSELTFALLLSFVRNLRASSLQVENGDWGREAFSGFQLSEKRLGIVGLGRLGTISAKIATGFNMDVAYCDPNVEAPLEKLELKPLLHRSDIIFLHLHLSETNENLINQDSLKGIGKNKILVNTSRGKIVDETAIIDALDNGTLAGYLTDVIDGEWLGHKKRREHILVSRAREVGDVLITPHIGGATRESIYLARSYVLSEIQSWVQTRREAK